MTRPLAFLLCLAGVVWLGYESLHFRQAIRDSLQEAYSLMGQVVPERSTDAGKVLNSYYEDVYASMPSIFFPAGMLFVGATVLFLMRRSAEPGAPPNGGPTAAVDNSNAPGGPPSVS